MLEGKLRLNSSNLSLLELNLLRLSFSSLKNLLNCYTAASHCCGVLIWTEITFLVTGWKADPVICNNPFRVHTLKCKQERVFQWAYLL